MGKMDATRHIITGIISELAYPVDEPPQTTKVVANVRAKLRKTVNGVVYSTENAGRMEQEVTRLTDVCGTTSEIGLCWTPIRGGSTISKLILLLTTAVKISGAPRRYYSIHKVITDSLVPDEVFE